MDLGVLPVGGSVRVQVSQEGPVGSFQATSRVARLSGVLVRKSDEEVVLRVPLAPGSEFGQELSIPTTSIRLVRSRKKKFLLVISEMLIDPFLPMKTS